MAQDSFINDFYKAPHEKTNFGIQILFVIGLYDCLPVNEIFTIFKKHIPFSLFNKLRKYCLSESTSTTISWDYCKSQLDLCNLSVCSQELIQVLNNLIPQEKYCKTFHIGQNQNSITATEPTHANTESLVLNFMTCIYKRNIIATVVKYIILNNILQKLNSSLLTPSYKGIFSHIQKRLNELIFESVLMAFNGQNYDCFLIANPLILCLTKLKHKISIFKKGNSISTIHIRINHNIQAKSKKKNNCMFLSNLYIKDIRNMVSATMTLDQIGTLFKIPFKKLCFPYNKSTSIAVLKNTTSLHPLDDTYWKDPFLNKTISVESRINAQNLFDQKDFSNLYEYNTYYLTLDCLLLHSIIITLFQTYLKDSINIFIRRNYSQSNLAFQQLFIVEPSRQINHVLAPKKMSHPFINYFIKKSVTGGLCTAFVHNNIDQNTVINSHLAYVDKNLDPISWPNFHPEAEMTFDKKPDGILTIDIRSLYPSASVKPIPVNTPLIYTRFTQRDSQNLPNSSSMLNIKSFCTQVQTTGNVETDCFKLINKPPRNYPEYNSINYYLSCLPKDINIIRFQSNFTALGQLYFVQYPVDGFLVYTQNENIFIKIINYNSTHWHGHIETCPIENNAKQKEYLEKTRLVKKNIEDLFLHFIQHFQISNVSFQYVEISECQFVNHQIPKMRKLICNFNPKYKYNNFLQNILNKKLTGFIVTKNLELKNQNPIFGFLIQKAYYELKSLSPYTKSLLHHFQGSERVVSLHKASSFMVLSTQYFIWLHTVFGFKEIPDIYHGMFFQFEHYLRDQIESKLQKRKELKHLIKNETDITIKQTLEIQAELIKLMLNSCYGFTLCNLTSSKFKCFKNAQSLSKHKAFTKKIKSSIQLAPKVFLNETYAIQPPFSTMLGHVGSSILFFSKIILLKRLYFVLKYLNPSKAQLLYMDTDSAHILLHKKVFDENIDECFRHDFHCLYSKHFEHAQSKKTAGIWVIEGFFTRADYIGEKSYVLHNDPLNETTSHMKGLNRHFQSRFVKENIDKNIFPYIRFNIFQKSSDFIIFKTNLSKDLFSNYVPIKRFFCCASGSLPLKLDN